MGARSQLAEQFGVLGIVKQYGGADAIHVIIGIGPVHAAGYALASCGVFERQRHIHQG